MEGIEKITEKIMLDAEEQITLLLAETDQKVAQIGQQAQEQAGRESAQLMEHGRLTAAERLERLQSAAHMETRKMTLAVKQEVLGEAFDLALEKLCTLPEQQYIDLLTELALEASSTGRERLIFSTKDRARVGKQVVVAVNERLVSQLAPELPGAITESKVGAFLGKVVNSATAQITGTGLLTLAEETREIKGGFIMVDDDVEISCAFETLVRLQRETLEKDVAKALFE